MRALLPLLLIPLLLTACRPSREDRLAALEDSLQVVLGRYPEALIAVSVRDDLTGIRLDLNGDSLLHAASTMKIPVMIEVFRQAQQGRFSLDDSILVRNEFRSIVDSSPYTIEDDSDDSIRAYLGRHLSIRELTRRMITVSSNLATNLLIQHVGADSVQATIERIGTRNMQVRRGVEDNLAYEAGLNNTATANDLALLLHRIGRGEAVSAQADEEMRRILLQQEFNTMIPAGLPAGTPVAHKTGWITGISHDAALVMPRESQPYTLVVLTRGFSDARTADRAGAEIARRVHRALRLEEEE